MNTICPPSLVRGGEGEGEGRFFERRNAPLTPTLSHSVSFRRMADRGGTCDCPDGETNTAAEQSA